MNSTSNPIPAIERVEEATREIGILIVALSPLDAAFAPAQPALLLRTLFLTGTGLLFFGLALLMERRRSHAA